MREWLARRRSATLIVVVDTEFDRWAALSLDREAYPKEQSPTTIEKVTAALDTRFPGLVQQVEEADNCRATGVAHSKAGCPHARRWR